MPLRDVAVALVAPVPLFELGVVCEVFGLDRTDLGLPGYDLAVCGPSTAPMPTTSGVPVTPSHPYGRLASAELIVVPGAAPPAGRPPSAELVRELTAATGRGATVASVCTGAFVLAAAGLLDGRRATTHWRHVPLLARLHPAVTLEPDSLYVEDGPVATSAGSTAALDLCLHLVRRAHGAEVANRIARDLVAPPHRPGGQAQYVETTVPAPDADDLAGVLVWALEHLDEPLRVDDLAARALMSPRTFARRFREHTGTTPAGWLATQRLLLAERLLERGEDTVSAVAGQAGFGSAETLRRHLGRARGVTPDAYRRTFRLDRE
ncbi:MAG TPA: helix-turn-helix domain-containing protein [Mycobacteriales bacterium]|jgi:transcriptional regulator GlxA family with amidase domain|nr:helix-turn-helix domain-containing protein [Mycobacteriales bacterium]